MTILFLYQNIESGAKLSTEAIIHALKKMYPEDTYISYKQPSQKFKGSFSYLINLCWSIKNYYDVIQSTQADIIYSVMFTSALSYLLSSKKNIPYLFHLHGDQSFEKFDRRHRVIDFFRYPYFHLVNWFTISLQTLALKTAKKVIFVSKESATEIAKRYLLNGNVSSIVIENGVDQHQFKPVSTTQKVKLQQHLTKSREILISYVGRMDKKKGVLNLIKALPYIDRPTKQKINLLLAYPKPIDTFSQKFLQSVKDEFKKNKLNHKLILKENFTPLEKIYQASDLVVLPSIQEMLPLVMLESLACGTLFLSTQVGHVPTILKQISSSLVMKDNQPETIAKHISKILGFHGTQKAKLLAKAQIVVKKYTWEKSAEKLHDLFVSITQ